MAASPALVYVESENIVQYKKAAAVIKIITQRARLFGAVKEDMGGGVGRTLTVVSYNSEYDKPKAEMLVEIVRSVGVPTVRAEINSSSDGNPGVLTIWFGRDAEK